MAGKEIWVQAKPEKASVHEVGVGRLQPGSPQLFSGFRNNVPEISGGGGWGQRRMVQSQVEVWGPVYPAFGD